MKKIISNFALNYIKKTMPPISDTERDAINAGDTFLDAQIFQSNIDYKYIQDNKLNTLSEEEENFINNQVSKLCEMIKDFDIIENKDLPNEIWEYLKKEKFFSMIIPKEYGGLEFSAYANSTIVATIASVSSSVAVTVMVPNSLGPGELLMKYGTEEQKNKWLPRLSNGTDIPCFALTAPAAGSDAGSIPDTGIVMYKNINGEEKLGINLNFSKRYITLAPVATIMGLAFKMYDPNKILSDKEDLGITCALIPTNHEGIDNSNRHRAMDLAFMNGPIFGKDVFIPLDYIIGGQEYIGKGWRMLVECLSAGRGISLPALSAATAQTAYRTTSAYSYLRKQFGLSINKFEGIEESLAKIAGFNYIIEATRRLTTHIIDEGYHPSVITAITKYHTTELARKALTEAMDIQAGKAIIQGESNYFKNGYLGMPIAITVEGANILTRNLMIFGQGSLRCHPYLLEEMDYLEKELDDKLKKEFSNLFWKHVGYSTKNGLKSILHNISGHWFEKSPNKTKFKSYYKNISQMSRTLAFTADISLLYLGGNLKRKEYLSARLGDLLSYIYMSLAVLKYAEKYNTEADIYHADWALQYLNFEMQKSFDEYLKNFPSSFISSIVKLTTRTLGVNYEMPKHTLNQKLCSFMLDNKEDSFRNRLSHLSYKKGQYNPVTVVEDAFIAVLNNKDIENKILNAQKEGKIKKHPILSEVVEDAFKLNIISNEDKNKILYSEELRWKVINVDHFKK